MLTTAGRDGVVRRAVKGLMYRIGDCLPDASDSKRTWASPEDNLGSVAKTRVGLHFCANLEAMVKTRAWPFLSSCVSHRHVC